MLPGLNSNVTHAGIEYHVQTEDLGRQNPFVLTLVFQAGAIIAREKVNYRDTLGQGATESQIKSFMEQQHRRVMDRINAGRLHETSPPEGKRPPASKPQPRPRMPGLPPADESLDELIQEYLRSRGTPGPGQD
jgi:hypothetical protein